MTTVVRAGHELEARRTNPLADDEMAMETPAITGCRLLIRTEQRVYCIE